MMLWSTWALVALALLVALVALIWWVRGRTPDDVILGGVALLELGLLAQGVFAIVAPFGGNQPRGDGVEIGLYLVTALIIPVAAVFWALAERSRWSTLILAIAALTVAVMTLRMWTLWSVG